MARENDEIDVIFLPFLFNEFSYIKSDDDDNDNQLAMYIFKIRSIVKRPRRAFESLLLVLFVLVIFVLLPSREKHAENHFLPQNQAKVHPESEPGDPVESLDHGLPELPKYIHLDLKGAPPIADAFFRPFFTFLNRLDMGVKGVLIEYEDTLPLRGSLSNVIHREAYSRADIQSIRNAAKENRLEIIPLIQTFGHLEWLLKLEGYIDYRDNPLSPMIISPCVEKTYVLLEDLLKQTLDLHPDSGVIHIGCDEVQLTQMHPACRSNTLSTAEVYVRHVRRVVDIVKKLRPTIRILIWDDIVRDQHIINNEALLSELKGLVEPVSWNYKPQIEESYKNSPVWKVYSNLFSHTWAASAFKGGLHRYSMVTNTTHHVLNNRQWIYFLESSNLPEKVLSSIILTGWSRFDHFMPICDLLPTAYASLIYSLHVLNTNIYLPDGFNMDCQSVIRSVGKDVQICELLPGLSIWSSLSSFERFLDKVQRRLKFFETVAPTYNREHFFVRRHDLNGYLSEMKSLTRDLSSFKELIQSHLKNLYAIDVIDEWFDLYINPVDKHLKTIFSQFSAASEQRVWPRRPLL